MTQEQRKNIESKIERLRERIDSIDLERASIIKDINDIANGDFTIPHETREAIYKIVVTGDEGNETLKLIEQ